MFELMSRYAASQIPFLFYTDYLGSKAHVIPLDALEAHGIAYAIREHPKNGDKTLSRTPIPYTTYKDKFDALIEEIRRGNTYLANLTQPTPITTNLTLREIFERSDAPYRLHVKDQFVCFSPEPFITIENDTINTFPMKGTIDADIQDAESRILANPKEMAEHTMIVDLLRNDLSQIATQVTVERFRYTQTIAAGAKRLLHVSSHISGTLPSDWRSHLGTMIRKLLPAGSISGTPKISTVRILKHIEGYDRGYFSGVFGIYDGKKLESAVMIRFIEQNGEQLIYKSGGGITLDSKSMDEYTEMLEKVYIP
ncbi:MAG: aminodeoxychorismate synthase component I [Campylobacterales bacterium]|nr:aminodeoxychorismate synthase component I [Campylobacterales bacterium]